jgi:hypothetical protein
MVISMTRFKKKLGYNKILLADGSLVFSKIFNYKKLVRFEVFESSNKESGVVEFNKK